MPSERAIGKALYWTLPDGKLLLKTPEGIEAMGGVEIRIVLAVTALYFAIVSSTRSGLTGKRKRDIIFLSII